MSGKKSLGGRYSVWTRRAKDEQWCIWEARDGLRAWLWSHASRRASKIAREQGIDVDIRPAEQRHLAVWQAEQGRRDACRSI